MHVNPRNSFEFYVYFHRMANYDDDYDKLFSQKGPLVVHGLFIKGKTRKRYRKFLGPIKSEY